MSLGMQEILPSGGLANFQNHISQIADLGRHEDAYIAHLAEGETVVPMDVLNSNPRLKAMLFSQMIEMGIDPQRYIVGNELNSINPVTGQPEFFLKKIFKKAKKAVKKLAPYAGLIAGAMGAGPWASAGIGALGGYYGEGDVEGALKGGLYGYTAGSAFGGKPLFGKGAKGYEFFPEGRGGWLTQAAGTDVTNAEKAVKVAKQDFINNPTGPNLTTFDNAEKALKMVKPGFLEGMSGMDKLLLGGAGVMGASDFLGGDEDDELQGPGEGWYDIHPETPWYGRFGNPQLEEGGIVGLANGGSPRDVHPGTGDFISRRYGRGAEADPTGEGYQFDFDVDGENRTYSFDEPGITNEARRAFLAREGIIPDDFITRRAELGGVEADPTDDFITRRAELGAMSALAGGALGAVMQKAYQLAKAMKTFGTVEEDDIRRAMEMLRTMTPEEFESIIARSEQDIQMINEFRNIGEEGSPHDYTESNSLDKANQFFEEGAQDFGRTPRVVYDEEGNVQDFGRTPRVVYDEEGNVQDLQFPWEEQYTEDKYADGGIAHLAGGSFPRRTGSIAGPGGPRDDRVPAMLSDGEFVMTAEAVRNAGGGNRRAGAKRMYELMNNLEQGTA